MTHAAPLVRLALAYVCGVVAGSLGAPLWLAPLAGGLGTTVPILTWKGPGALALFISLTAGWSAVAVAPDVCVPRPGPAPEVRGHFLATPRDGSAPFALEGGCGRFTVVVPPDATPPPAGVPLAVHGTWVEGRYRPWLRMTSFEAAEATGDVTGRLARAAVRWRDALVARLPRLYGDRAPLVSALVFARREGLDADVRDRFAVTGIAHLLAISGFHVGVIAGIAVGLLRLVGYSRRGAALGAAALSWVYVGFIGFPDAACRAALILAFVAASRARGRPPSRWGALAGAALLLLAVDPRRAVSAGFQLSFAGAAGLVAWAGPLGRTFQRWGRGRLPTSFASALAAGVAATVATLPVVAWHFERVSLVGIPVTMVASPLVSLALPGALATIVLDPVAPAAAAFLAGGVDVLLMALLRLTEEVGTWPGVSLWMTRGTVVAGGVGVVAAQAVARHPRIGGHARRRLVVAYMAVAVVGWPVAVTLEGRGTLELLIIDVGQGDALAVRTPGGRWLLVDAGPPGDGSAPAHPVVATLRARGVRRLEALVLTHPDADHFGGAGAVLTSFRVGRVLDPLLPAPKPAYADVLEIAQARGVPWSAARAGMKWTVDDVDFEVLHPGEALPEEANEASVVILVRWRTFEALLTGDAGVDVERRVSPSAGDIEVLKVGHHGSRTSTGHDLLSITRPEVAVISAGRRNRYGHPHGEVVERLDDAGVRIARTDIHGDIRLLVDRSGRMDVRLQRAHVGG